MLTLCAIRFETCLYIVNFKFGISKSNKLATLVR